MKKMKLTKGKLAALIAVGCMVIALPAMAFYKTYPYAMDGYDTEIITALTPTATPVYFNTRPSSGGDVEIILEGASDKRATFPYRTSRDDWEVLVTPNTQLSIYGHALSQYTTIGVLHVRY